MDSDGSTEQKYFMTDNLYSGDAHGNQDIFEVPFRNSLVPGAPEFGSSDSSAGTPSIIYRGPVSGTEAWGLQISEASRMRGNSSFAGGAAVGMIA